MFADEIRRAIAAASRITLPQVTALLWRAYADGKVTEAEAEALSGLIEARTTSAPQMRHNLGNTQVLTSPDPGRSNAPEAGISPCGTAQPDRPQDRQNSPRRAVGSRPRTEYASLERRRRWAASGRLPPGLAARFTLAEQAVLALVAAETARRGDYRLAHEHAAALAGVSRSTVKNALREARRLGLLTIEERPVTGFRNLPNIVRIVGREWLAWLRLARKPGGYQGNPDARPSSAEGIGVKSATRTHTQVPDLGESRTTEPKKGCRRAASDLDRSGPSRIRAGGSAG